MSVSENQIDPRHDLTRGRLRVWGVVVLVLGVILMATGVYRMFSPAWEEKPVVAQDRPDPGAGFLEGRKSFDQVKQDMDKQFRDQSQAMHRSFQDSAATSFSGFAMTAVGMVLLAVGATMTRMGYLGRVARYASAELTPVATDTLNYAGAAGRQGIHDIAQGIASGIRDSRSLKCPQCGTVNDAGASFCNHCGQRLN